MQRRRNRCLVLHRILCLILIFDFVSMTGRIWSETIRVCFVFGIGKNQREKLFVSVMKTKRLRVQAPLIWRDPLVA